MAVAAAAAPAAMGWAAAVATPEVATEAARLASDQQIARRGSDGLVIVWPVGRLSTAVRLTSELRGAREVARVECLLGWQQPHVVATSVSERQRRASGNGVGARRRWDLAPP
eukprot:scaffold22303_cov67-Phaeocystis_antarctica.AAC.4